MFNAEKVKNECVQWIRDWFEENGHNCNAIVGISGGKDSSVVAALCVEALGADRVIGVMLPNGTQEDIDDCYKLIRYLGIDHAQLNIRSIYELAVDWADFAMSFSELSYHKDVKPSEQSLINLAPRIRMTMLYFIAQSMNGRVANTCNLSEDWIGYSTRYGDTAGDFSPLSDLTTDEVVAIGEVLGLPTELVHKVPSDGLCGKTDEDRFGFTYEVLNKYIRTGVCEDDRVKEKIDGLHEQNLFKLLPMPKFEYIVKEL